MGGGFVTCILYRVADTKGVSRWRGFCYVYIVSYRGYQGWFEGRGFVKGMLYQFAYTKGGLRGKGVLLRIYSGSCRGYQGWFEWRGFF